VGKAVIQISGHGGKTQSNRQPITCGAACTDRTEESLMGLSNYIMFFAGICIGIWISAYAHNRYYRSELWSARKRVMLQQLKVQESAARAETESYEHSISDSLDQRIKSSK
jgi:hypothetical protein